MTRTQDAALYRNRHLCDAVAAKGGIARRTTLRRMGHTDYAIAMAVSAGSLVAIRRMWVALPDADPHLAAAARAGVIVACVTQAKRLGLWVLDEPGAPAHVAAPPHAGRIDVLSGTIVHRRRPLVARHPDALVDPIENVLVTMAACQPYESALATWESALRQKLVDPLALGRLELPAIAKELLETACPFSDSGLESFVVPRLRWMKLRIVPQAWIAGRRVDFLIGERLVLQIDGAHHVGAQRTNDNKHDALLTLMGYHVIRVGYDQVVRDWPGVQELIMRAVAQGLHRAR